MYIFVNRFKEISNCLFCEGKNNCKCHTLNVFVYENFMFYKTNKQHFLELIKGNTNTTPWLEEYRNKNEQKELLIKIKLLFSNAKNIVIFPTTPHLISFAENIDDHAKF